MHLSPAPPSRRGAFLAGLRATIPLLLGTVPFGLIYGVLARGGGLTVPAALGMSSVVFAGSAQFVVIRLFGGGAPALVILFTVTVINLRHALYSASMTPYLKRLSPLWKAVLAYLLTDEAYAVAISRYRADDVAQGLAGEPVATTVGHWYFLGAGLTMWSSWQMATAAGILLGVQVPASWSLDFTLALTFIALVVPALADAPGAPAAALVGGIVAALAAGLPFKTGLVLGALCGTAAGLLLEAGRRRGQPSPKAALPAAQESEER